MHLRAVSAFALVAVLASCGSKASSDGGTDAAGAGGGNGGGAGTSGAAGTGGGGAGGSAAGGASAGGGTGGSNLDAAIGDAMCAPVERPVAGFKPDILVLLDESASMNRDENDQMCGTGAGSNCGATSKWAQTYPAVEQVVAATDTTVNWGLKFFAEFNNTASMPSVSCTVSDGAAVPIANMNTAAIAAAIAARTSANGALMNGGSNTPTRTAVTSAAAYLSTLTDGNPRFILLATDGLPNCMAGTSNLLSDDFIGAIQSVTDASAAGIATFVVGIGGFSSGLADQTLSQMAIAGGYPRSSTSTDYRSYYPATNSGELIAALNQLVGIARSCRMPLGVPPPGFSGDAIDVLDNGTTVPRDPNHLNGWDYADATHTSFNLYGPVCSAIMNGAVARISVVFHCLPAG